MIKIILKYLGWRIKSIKKEYRNNIFDWILWLPLDLVAILVFNFYMSYNFNVESEGIKK